MIRLVLCLLALCLLASESPAAEAGRVHFAYLQSYDGDQPRDPDWGGCVFLGAYENGRFTAPPEEFRTDTPTPDWWYSDIDRRLDAIAQWRAALNRALDGFPEGKALFGVDPQGHSIAATARSVEREPGEALDSLKVHLETKTLRSVPVLLATADLPLRVLKQDTAALDPELDATLRKKAPELMAIHGTREGNSLGKPKATRVEGAPEYLTVVYPSLWDENGDGKLVERGSYFFLYHVPDKRIVRADFGHPEWSDDSMVLTVVPEIFFRVADRPEVYFAGASETGWEDPSSKGLFELATGRELMRCH